MRILVRKQKLMATVIINYIIVHSTHFDYEDFQEIFSTFQTTCPCIEITSDRGTPPSKWVVELLRKHCTAPIVK